MKRLLLTLMTLLVLLVFGLAAPPTVKHKKKHKGPDLSLYTPDADAPTFGGGSSASTEAVAGVGAVLGTAVYMGSRINPDHAGRASVVPEPPAIAVMAVGAAALLRRRRKV